MQGRSNSVTLKVPNHVKPSTQDAAFSARIYCLSRPVRSHKAGGIPMLGSMCFETEYFIYISRSHTKDSMQPAKMRQPDLDRPSVPGVRACSHLIYDDHVDSRRSSRLPLHIFPGVVYSCFGTSDGIFASSKSTTRTSIENPTSERPRTFSGMGGVTEFGRVESDPYEWPHDAPMNPKTTALVIVDMQQDCK